MQVDAFTVDWGKWSPYAFLPFSLLDRCLTKLDTDRVRDFTGHSLVAHSSLLQNNAKAFEKAASGPPPQAG